MQTWFIGVITETLEVETVTEETVTVQHLVKTKQSTRVNRVPEHTEY